MPFVCSVDVQSYWCVPDSYITQSLTDLQCMYNIGESLKDVKRRLIKHNIYLPSKIKSCAICIIECDYLNAYIKRGAHSVYILTLLKVFLVEICTIVDESN